MSVDATMVRWGLGWLLSVCLAVTGGAYWAGGLNRQAANQEQRLFDQQELTKAWLDGKFTELSGELKSLTRQVDFLSHAIDELRAEQVRLRERVASLEARSGD